MAKKPKKPIPHPAMAGEFTWLTKDGRQVLVQDMDDEHLANALAMMERKHPSLLLYEMAARLETHAHPSWIKIDEHDAKWRVILVMRDEVERREVRRQALKQIRTKWEDYGTNHLGDQ